MRRYLLPLFDAAIGALGLARPPEIVLERPKSPERGDIATGIALTIRRELQIPAEVIAERIVAELRTDGTVVESVDIARNGFINIRFTPLFVRIRLEEFERRIAAAGPIDPTAAPPSDIRAAGTPGQGRRRAVIEAVERLATVADPSIALPHVKVSQAVVIRWDRAEEHESVDAVNALVERLGDDLFRYFLLSRPPSRPLTIDLRLFDPHSDTIPLRRIQYTYAHIRALGRFAATQGIVASATFPPEADERGPESTLAREIVLLDHAIETAVRRGEPRIVIDHLGSIVERFHEFVNLRRIVAAESAAGGRLHLAMIAGSAIAFGLGLLGLAAPERI